MKTTSTLFCLLFFTNTIFAFLNVDSLQTRLGEDISSSEKVEILADLAYEFRRKDIDKALEYNQEAMALVEQEPDHPKKSELNRIFAIIYRNKGEIEKSISYAEECIRLAEEAKDELAIGKAHYLICTIYYEYDKLEDCLENGLKAHRIFTALPDTQGMVRTFPMLGTVLNSLERYEEAEPYFTEAIRLSKIIGWDMGLANAHNNMAGAFLDQKMYRKSIDSYKKCLEIDKKIEYTWGVGNANYNIGNVYVVIKEWVKAKEHLQIAYDIIIGIGVEQDMARIKGKLGYTLFHLGERKKGIEFLEESIAVAEKEEYDEIHRDGLEMLSILQNDAGEYSKAYNTHISYKKASDKLKDEKLESQVNKLEVQFRTSEQKGEIASLNVQNELAALQLSTARKQNMGLGLGLGIFGLLSFFLFRLYRKLQDQNKVVSEALKDKELLLREIHHRVKNNLQVISSILSLQSRYVEDEGALEVLKEGRDRVKSMALIHQNLYQEGNLSGIQMKEYFTKLIKGLFNSYNISPDKVSLSTNIEQINLDVDTVIPLGLIVNELVSNSLKHGFPNEREGNINITLSEKDNELQLVVEDNGVGMKDEKDFLESNSMGNKLITAFKNKLDARLEVDREGGTRIEMGIREYVKVG